MKDNVQKLWIPEQPQNQSVKLECLKIASSKTKDRQIMIDLAQKLYEWISSGARNS